MLYILNVDEGNPDLEKSEPKNYHKKNDMAMNDDKKALASPQSIVIDRPLISFL